MYGKHLNWGQKLLKRYCEWWRTVEKETGIDDDIDESLDDMFSNADGRTSPYYLRYELKRRGLKIMTYRTVGIISTLLAMSVILNLVLFAPHGFIK